MYRVNHRQSVTQSQGQSDMTATQTQTPATLSLAQLQIAQAQMAFDRYDFGAPVRIVRRGFVNYGDHVTTEVEFQNENGVFDNGPKGGFLVYFAAGSYQIEDARAMIHGSQIGHMPGAELREFEARLDEGVDMLDMEGVELVEQWLEARDESKGYILGVRIGDAGRVHDLRSHPIVEAEEAIQEAISDDRAGVSVLITGQRADRIREAVAVRRVTLQAAAQNARTPGSPAI
ncbi:hypothetical protein OIU34_23080 [Pararhizobium sp. BT-229]|uniref:hypothetical protein n=1 Tax=Pararhizobium sp. BT-229 TaxID=2986923 RepID=UPI0021F7B7FE|nr:hypothetical protein [Pararhizobium sp. BT-229]MCV9964779.1 hypothetical protein [Pararhizobium sp. BT-229]